MRANRYVSYLAAEIEPAALANARTFEREIENTLNRISAKSAKGSGGFANQALGVGVSRNLSSISTASQKAKRDLDVLDAAQLKTSRGAQLMGASFSRAADALQIVQGPLGPIAGRLSALGQVLRSLAGFTLAGVLAGGGAFALGSIATEYQKMHDTLVPVIGDQKALGIAMTDVIGIAGRTHQALQPVAELYTQFSRVGKDAGLSQQRIARLTETVSKATKIGGGDPEAQRGAIIQFGQALTANFHGSGQELQSILEQTPALAQAIADGLGTQTSKLKQLAKEGQLSTELVVKALERSADMIDERFARMPPRIGKSLQDLTNSLSVFVGRMDETTGATTGVANALEYLSGHLRGVVVLAGTLAAAFSGRMFAGAIEGAQAMAFRISAIAPLTREQIATNELFKRSIQERAAAEAVEATTAVAGAKEYQAQLRIQIGLIEKQIATQARALEMARTLDAGMRTSGGTGASPALVSSYEELNASERALVATNEALIASDAELAAAEERLAAATQVLVVADEELVVAETAAAAASGRLAGAKAILQGAIGRTMNAASGLVGFLGGPWGIAFTVAAGWATYLATKTDDAKEAIDRFKGGQEGLAAILENTTGKMRDQAGAALMLARALHETNLAKAKQSLRDTNEELANDIAGFSAKLPAKAGFNGDFARAQELRRRAASGAFMPTRDLAELQQLIDKYPNASKDGVITTLLFGTHPGNTKQDVLGVTAAMIELKDAQKDLDDFDKRKNQKLGALVGGPGAAKPLSKADLNAQARLLAAQDPLSKARAELQLAMREGPKGGEDNDAYKQRVAGLIQNVSALAQAHKAAAGAKSSDRAAQAALNKEMREAERGRDNAAKLAGIEDQFSDDSPIRRLDKLRDAAAAAKRQVDDLVGERVGDRIFTREDATTVQNRIDAHEKSQERKPVVDSLNQAQQELAVQKLISLGLGDQAEFVRRKYELEKQVGALLPEEEQDIRNQIAQQNRLNDVLAKRSDLIENNARFLDSFRDTVESSIKSLLKGDFKGGFKNFFKGIQDAFLTAKAHELTLKLIGDPGKKYRDDMTRGLNDSASKLNTSGDNLDKSATALDSAASALQSAAGAKAPIGSNLIRTNDVTSFPDLLPELLDQMNGPKEATPVTDPNSIVITGKRLQQSNGVEGIDSLFGKTLGSFGSSVVSAGIGAINSMFGGVGKMQGAVTGGGISDALGSIGQAVGQAYPMFAAGMAATSVISKVVGLKNFAGGAFGVLGNLVAKLFGFGKAKKGSATISDLSGNFNVTGNSGAAKDAATGAAGGVVSGLQRVIDALGATMGQFAVSIGYNADKKKYVVDERGLGRLKTGGGPDDTPEFDSEEEAVRYAILNAIQDGAVKGIREGTQRLLRAGHDLDTALDKAIKFEGVFKALKRIKDPVGAAIDDLNVQFQNLISIFNEAGASAEEWGQLQELYDLQRADAIKQATQDTVSALSDFIQQMTAGQESPLSKRTVYNNSKAEVDKFRADIAAGKVVDQQALVTALNNMEQASQSLNGSRSAFYSDFQDILALATKAKENATGAVATTPTPLPPSPFDSPGPWTQLVGGQTTTNGLLTDIRDILTSGGGTAQPGGSTIDTLPYYGGVSGGGGGGDNGLSGLSFNRYA